jgi:hypothetical protein
MRRRIACVGSGKVKRWLAFLGPDAVRSKRDA